MIDREKRTLALGALLVSALALGGCSTSIADMPLVGSSADAPARLKEAGAYLPCHPIGKRAPWRRHSAPSSRAS